MEDQSIILFDGYCNFCSGSVDFILRHDKKKHFKFAASESEAGKKLLNVYRFNQTDSIILITNAKSYRYSSAILKICSLLNFPINLLAIFFIIPAFFRDGIYKWIAANRYKWFGKRETCRLPPAGEIERFLN